MKKVFLSFICLSAAGLMQAVNPLNIELGSVTNEENILYKPSSLEDYSFHTTISRITKITSTGGKITNYSKCSVYKDEYGNFKIQYNGDLYHVSTSDHNKFTHMFSDGRGCWYFNM